MSSSIVKTKTKEQEELEEECVENILHHVEKPYHFAGRGGQLGPKTQEFLRRQVMETGGSARGFLDTLFKGYTPAVNAGLSEIRRTKRKCDMRDRLRAKLEAKKKA